MGTDVPDGADGELESFEPGGTGSTAITGETGQGCSHRVTIDPVADAFGVYWG